jgi:hypothetical protein
MIKALAEGVQSWTYQSQNYISVLCKLSILSYSITAAENKLRHILVNGNFILTDAQPWTLAIFLNIFLFLCITHLMCPPICLAILYCEYRRALPASAGALSFSLNTTARAIPII